MSNRSPFYSEEELKALERQAKRESSQYWKEFWKDEELVQILVDVCDEDDKEFYAKQKRGGC